MHKEIIEALKRVALNDNYPENRAEAILTLAKMAGGDTELIPFFSSILTGDTDPEVRLKALYALAQYNAPEAIPAILNALGDPCFEIRGEAIRYIRRHIGENA